MQTSRIALLIAVALTTSTITGCAGSAVRGIYNMTATPDAAVCDSTLGLTISAAEQKLNMGKPDAVKRKAGKNVRLYTKGSLKAELTIGQDGKVSDASCEQIDSK